METGKKPPRHSASRSRRFRKSCGVGSSRTSTRRRPRCAWGFCDGAGLVALAVLFLAGEATAIERRAWLFEQLAALPVATRLDERRTQLVLSGVTYADAISVQAMGLLDLGPVELKAQYSERLFPLLTDVGREQATLLQGDKRTLGLEVARYYVNRHRQYGRLGVEALFLMPRNRGYAKLGMAMGVVDGPADPWAFALEVAFLLSLPRGDDVLVARMETRRRLSSSSLRPPTLGGFIQWTYRLRPMGAPGDYEMMFFSFGPAFTWGGFRLSLGVRLSLDKRVDAANVESNPSGVRAPDVALAFQL